jgi:ankyrin repeat protein
LETKQWCLSEAAFWDWMEVVRYLIEEGVDPNCKEYGCPAICSAAKNEKRMNKMIEYLISVGADINGRNLNPGTIDWNALHSAAYYGQFESVKLLVSLGCDFKAKENTGKTPLQFAQLYERKDIVEFLKQIEQK